MAQAPQLRAATQDPVMGGRNPDQHVTNPRSSPPTPEYHLWRRQDHASSFRRLEPEGCQIHQAWSPLEVLVDPILRRIDPETAPRSVCKAAFGCLESRKYVRLDLISQRLLIVLQIVLSRTKHLRSSSFRQMQTDPLPASSQPFNKLLARRTSKAR